MFKNYNNYILNEKSNAKKEKEKAEIDRSIKIIRGIVKKNSIELSDKHLLDETADGKKTQAGKNYFTLFTYIGDNEEFKNHQLVYQIELIEKKNINSDKNMIPNMVWTYSIIATQLLGKIDNKYKKDYFTKTDGVRGLQIVENIENINMLTNSPINLTAVQRKNVLGRSIPKEDNISQPENTSTSSTTIKQKVATNTITTTKQKTTNTETTTVPENNKPL